MHQGVHISRPEWVIRNNAGALAACVTYQSEHIELFFRVCPEAAAPRSEAFLPVGLLPAMRLNLPLQLEGALSPRLASHLSTIQNIYTSWDKKFARVPVCAGDSDIPPLPAKRGVGCFFSGGVDSFYSFLKNRDEITHLVFVHGFDLPLSDQTLRPRVAASLRQAAAELGKPLIEVETNVRDLLDRHMNWVISHGAALASAALALSGTLHKIYLPASNTYSNLFPTGSHPILDPLWSTEAMDIVHDGCEANRVEKVAKIADCDTALRWLRVCWENPDGEYNCGKCEKCQRTMLNLHVANALQRCPTFSQPLDPHFIARVPAWSAGIRIHCEENLHALEAQNRDPELQRALRDCLALKHHKGIRRLVRGGVKRLRRLVHSA